RTVLHVASSNGHLNIVKHLIEKGVNNLNAADKWGNTALHEAAAKGHLDIVRYLLGKGCDPLLKTRDGKTPLGVS
ncbi:hypothetical protein GYMLUDRAFT_137560, partial [Collybiopsis luxurians FD-317 M1]